MRPHGPVATTALIALMPPAVAEVLDCSAGRPPAGTGWSHHHVVTHLAPGSYAGCYDCAPRACDHRNRCDFNACVLYEAFDWTVCAIFATVFYPSACAFAYGFVQARRDGQWRKNVWVMRSTYVLCALWAMSVANLYVTLDAENREKARRQYYAKHSGTFVDESRSARVFSYCTSALHALVVVQLFKVLARAAREQSTRDMLDEQELRGEVVGALAEETAAGDPHERERSER